MDDLIQALTGVLDAKQELAECYAAGDYDADYYCAHRQDEYKRALGAFETALIRVIDRRVDQDVQAEDGHYHCWHDPHAGDLVWRNTETRVCCHCGETRTQPTFEVRPHGPHKPKLLWE